MSTTSTIDYSKYFTARSAARQPSAIRALQPFLSIPGMISLGGGMPNSSTFPFSAMSLTLADGTELKVDGDDMKTALQYSGTPGLGELVDRLAAMQQAEHNPPEGAADFGVAVTGGSQDGLAKAFDMVVDAGGSILVEKPTYSGSLAALEPMGANIVSVDTDADGLVPDHLDSVLSSWDVAAQGPKPGVLYTIPTGCNPTGASLPVDRRHQVYEIARKHDLLIFEDDPYYYLQYSATRLPSLFSMDVDGRVLRFDSFSKILSSGLRLGLVTGPKPLVDRINLHSQSSSLHTSGLSQAAALSLFRHWKVGEAGSDGGAGTGLGGLEAHVKAVVEFYERQCAAYLKSAETHLGDLVEFAPPTAGMFVWMKLKGVEDSFELIKGDAVKEKVLLVPGSSFIAGGEPSPYVRAAFSTASPEQIDTALERLGNLLRRTSAGK